MSQSKDSDKIETGGSRVKFWGGAVIVLMIILMLMPWNIGDRTHSGRASVLRGTASDGRKVMSDNTEFAAAELETLEDLYIEIRDPNNPASSGHAPLLQAIWGQDLYNKFKRSPEAYYLLVEESRKFGLGENPRVLGTLDRDQQNARELGLLNDGTVMVQDLHPLFGSPLYEASHSLFGARQMRAQISIPQAQTDGYISRVLPSALPPVNQQRYYTALRDLVSVQAAASISSSAVKPSTVMVDQRIARDGQSFTLQVASIDARPLVDSVSVPSDSELQKQLATYSNIPAGSVTADNPFGFGYQVQNGVKLQMLLISREEVRKVVQAEKSVYDWEVEARMAYAKDANQFKSLAATQPTTAPTTLPAAEASPTAPAVLPDAVAPFDQIKVGAIRMIVEKAVDARVEEISRKIRTTMSLDYQSWATAKNTKSTTQPSSLGVNYDSVEYLNRLAAAVQAEPRFKVLPIVQSEQSRFLDAEELSRDPAISKLAYSFEMNVAMKLGIQQFEIPAAQYIIEFARPFMQIETIEKAGSAVLEVLKPSDPLIDFTKETIAFIRLTDTAAAHPATDIEPIRSRLTAEVKLADAQNKAIEKAKAAITAIESSGKFEVPGAVVSTVVASPPRVLESLPPELGLNGSGYFQFYSELGRNLMGDEAGKPLAAINVPLAQKVFVAQRIALTPVGWTNAKELDEYRLILFDALSDQMAEPLSPRNQTGLTSKAVANDWLDVDSILARNQYVPVGKEKSE